MVKSNADKVCAHADISIAGSRVSASAEETGMLLGSGASASVDNSDRHEIDIKMSTGRYDTTAATFTSPRSLLTHKSTAHILIQPGESLPPQLSSASEPQRRQSLAEEITTRPSASSKRSVVRCAAVAGQSYGKEIPVPAEILQILESGMVSMPTFPKDEEAMMLAIVPQNSVEIQLSDVKNNESCDSRVPYRQSQEKRDENETETRRKVLPL